MVVFNCVFISVSGRAAISCRTFALQYKHGGVSQQCVGRHRDVTHIPTRWALTVWTVRFTVGTGMSQSTFWLLFRPNRERVKVEERARVGRFKQMRRMWIMGQKRGVHCGKERGKQTQIWLVLSLSSLCSLSRPSPYLGRCCIPDNCSSASPRPAPEMLLI